MFIRLESLTISDLRKIRCPGNPHSEAARTDSAFIGCVLTSRPTVRRIVALAAAIAVGVLLGSCPSLLALNPSLDISQYAHTAWNVREGFSLGNVYAMAQTSDGYARVRDLKFTHLTTNDGLSQGYVTAILQDRRGFMWFATRDGLNRYDGNAFVVYKNNPERPR